MCRLAIVCLAILLPFALFPLPCAAQGVITTVAGTTWAFRGDGGLATDAPLGRLQGVTVDSVGNVFAADTGNNHVVKISATGILTVVAGNGFTGFSGDDGIATSASLNLPFGVAVGLDGSLYIADVGNNRIRKVSPEGIITTVAGNGIGTGSTDGEGGDPADDLGDGGPATSASLGFPRGVATDAMGNLYIADTNNSRIRRMSAGGTITTIAGDGSAGFSGDGGPATAASLNQPGGVAVDAAGNLYIADTENKRIRKIDIAGTITTVAGGGIGFGDGGPATMASLSQLSGVAVDGAGNLYIADFGFLRIRKISTDGTISTVAGDGEIGFSGDGGPATMARLFSPEGVAVDQGGNVYIADTLNERVRKVGPGGIINTIAGNGSFKFSGDGGPATSAALQPVAVATDAGGNIYISQGTRVRKVDAVGTITTVAGNGAVGFSGDGGPATGASFDNASGVALDGTGNLYIADGNNNRIRKVSPGGTITTVAGSANQGFAGDDGPATNASLCLPQGVALDASGNLLIADNCNQRIRKVSPGGTITTVAGNGISGFSGDGGPATSASLANPFDVAVDDVGTIYIADRGNFRIRKVDPAGIITTVAGNGAPGFSGDGGPATTASLAPPRGVAADRGGNLYVADGTNGRIRKVGPDGIITTVAGGGGDLGDGGPATDAFLNFLSDAVVDEAGNLHIAEAGNDRIRKVLGAAPIFALAPATLRFSEPAGAPAVAAQQIAVASDVAGLGWSAQVSTESGGDWLSVSPSFGPAPGVIAVSVNVMNLSTGSYQGRVTVAAPLAAVSMQTVTVELTVEQALAPKLVVEPAGLTFEIPAGAGNPLAQTLRISKRGTGTLDWTARAETTVGGNWLELSPSSGSASGASPATVQVSAVVGELPPGVYPGAVQVESPTTNQTETIQVTLLVAPAKQTILASQSGLLFTGVEGGGAVPSQSFGILNSGEGVMGWTLEATALSGGNWLTVSPASGSSDAASLQVPLVEAEVNPSGLPAGRYSGLIRVNALGANNSPQLVTVTLDVLPAGSHPGVVVRPTNLIFATPAGTFSPGSQSVRVSTAAPGNLEARSGLFTLEGGDWLEILPPNLALSADDPRRVVVQPTLGELAPGAYRGQLAFQFSNLDNPSQVVPSQRVGILFLVVGTAGAAGGSEPHTLARAFDSEAQQECAPQQLLVVHRTLGINFASPVGFPTPIQAQVVNDCGDTVKTATVVASFSSGDPPLVLASLRNGIYVGTWQPVNSAAQVTVTVRASLPPLADAVVQAQGQVQANPTVSALFAGGVVNGASFASGEALAPGSIVSVFGLNLASGLSFASQVPLETTLGGATMNIRGVEVPLFFTSDGQINAQIPFELAPNSRPHVVVQTRRDGSGPEAVTVPATITLAEARPGIFSTNQQGSGQGAILDAQGQLVDSAAPAAAGEIIQVFCTGLGATNPLVASGQAAPGAEPLARVVVPVEAQVGGRTAAVHFAGLAPGFVGLYQVNVEIPADVEAGSSVPLLLLQNGVPSNTVTIAVQ